MSKHNYNELLHTIDVMVEEAITDIEAQNEEISCHKGCSYCCYLLVEVSWEEANLLADWVLKQPAKKKARYLEKIKDNAEAAKIIFKRYKKGLDFLTPATHGKPIPEKFYDNYFYKNSLPCPFLDKGSCSAYPVRPTPCRLHMVTSPPELCSQTVPEEVIGYNVPYRIDQLKEEVAPLNRAYFKDGRWGQLGIMVQAVLEERMEN